MRKFLVVVLFLVFAGGLHAMFASYPIENVPIDRVVRNLERKISADPRDINSRINLARVHAMAYALKEETAPVRKSRPQDPPSDEPEFGVLGNQFAYVKVKPPENPADVARANDHLRVAIELYDSTIALDPSNLIPRLGRAWCLDQSGQKKEAVAGYREVLKLAWEREGKGQLPRVQNFMTFTVETSGYLIPLLDPKLDAEEIKEIEAHRAQVRKDMATRPITPVAIPLGGNTNISDLIWNSAAVKFDADGSGIFKRWTWI